MSFRAQTTRVFLKDGDVTVTMIVEIVVMSKIVEFQLYLPFHQLSRPDAEVQADRLACWEVSIV